jgi:hypothetical protein
LVDKIIVTHRIRAVATAGQKIEIYFNAVGIIMLTENECIAEDWQGQVA